MGKVCDTRTALPLFLPGIQCGISRTKRKASSFNRGCTLRTTLESAEYFDICF